MNKEIMKNILEASSAELTKEEIQALLDEELNKSEEETDTGLIELCIEALSREADSAEDSCENSKGNIKKIKHRKIKKIFIIAAVVSVIAIITITASANVFIIDAESGIVNIFGKQISLNISALRNKEAEENNYDEFKDTYLFPVFRSNNCKLKSKETTSDTRKTIEFTFTDSGISGYIDITDNIFDKDFPIDTNIYTNVEQVKQIVIHQVDILIVSSANGSVQTFYNADDHNYCIFFEDISITEAIKLLEKEKGAIK